VTSDIAFRSAFAVAHTKTVSVVNLAQFVFFSNLPDDGQLRPKHVESNIHKQAGAYLVKERGGRPETPRQQSPTSSKLGGKMNTLNEKNGFSALNSF
jgi:hypothetical protein